MKRKAPIIKLIYPNNYSIKSNQETLAVILVSGLSFELNSFTKDTGLLIFNEITGKSKLLPLTFR